MAVLMVTHLAGLGKEFPDLVTENKIFKHTH